MGRLSASPNRAIGNDGTLVCPVAVRGLPGVMGEECCYAPATFQRCRRRDRCGAPASPGALPVSDPLSVQDVARVLTLAVPSGDIVDGETTPEAYPVMTPRPPSAVC